MYEDVKRMITATEFKNNLGMYLDYVADNDQIIITKNGKKAVRVCPYMKELDRYKIAREQAGAYDYGSDEISYEEFLTISEKSEQRLEFIGGQVIVMDSPTKFHQEISGNLHVLLRSYLKGKPCKVYYAPFDVTLKKFDKKLDKWLETPDVFQPDLIIACDSDITNDRGKYMGVPTLAIEIFSPSTRSRDMMIKLNTFGIAGVKEVWLVDPDSRQIMQYLFEDYEVKSYNVYREDDLLESLYFEGLSMKLEEVFEE